ncbi:hypothetical protein K466DRAFT_606690 [Polyporus arcularius HHB13444]|uniref:Uncharacterized protein n=1 Tax=Polyporus arcularius HHB13444 TaxID=1314778 RepID=A0A5C3NNC5_9APHY|nr:hypothetical protein K466DRAFT_606690 [Polyporus arcularius HHB13444]
MDVSEDESPIESLLGVQLQEELPTRQSASDRYRPSDAAASHLEAVHAETLQELKNANACNSTMSRALSDFQSGQQALDKRLTQLEDELAAVRKDYENGLRPAKLSYRQAQGSLNLERRGLESFRERTQDAIDDIQRRLKRVEVDTNVFKAQIVAQKTQMFNVDAVLLSMQTWAQKTSGAIAQLEEDSGHVMGLVRPMHDRSQVGEEMQSPSQLARLPEPSLLDEVQSLPSSSSDRTSESLSCLASPLAGHVAVAGEGTSSHVSCDASPITLARELTDPERNPLAHSLTSRLSEVAAHQSSSSDANSGQTSPIPDGNHPNALDTSNTPDMCCKGTRTASGSPDLSCQMDVQEPSDPEFAHGVVTSQDSSDAGSARTGLRNEVVPSPQDENARVIRDFLAFCNAVVFGYYVAFGTKVVGTPPARPSHRNLRPLSLRHRTEQDEEGPEFWTLLIKLAAERPCLFVTLTWYVFTFLWDTCTHLDGNDPYIGDLPMWEAAMRGR